MILACFTLVLSALKTQYDKFDLIISVFGLLKYWSKERAYFIHLFFWVILAVFQESGVTIFLNS